VSVRWCPPLSVAIVTHLVTRSLASPVVGDCCPHTLSKSPRLSPARWWRLHLFQFHVHGVVDYFLVFIGITLPVQIEN
jgi:hypothetical protein